MDKELKESFENLGKKLDIISALLLRLAPKNINEVVSLKDQIRILEGLGLRPVDMSKITGRSQNYINKELVAIRKEKKFGHK